MNSQMRTSAPREIHFRLWGVPSQLRAINFQLPYWSFEIANQPVRGLAPDGGGGALAIVGRHSLRRRTPGGAWTTVATSDFELSCSMAVRETIYVGTDDARMLR